MTDGGGKIYSLNHCGECWHSFTIHTFKSGTKEIGPCKAIACSCKKFIGSEVIHPMTEKEYLLLPIGID